jgi:hypothetical protein
MFGIVPRINQKDFVTPYFTWWLSGNYLLGAFVGTILDSIPSTPSVQIEDIPILLKKSSPEVSL